MKTLVFLVLFLMSSLCRAGAAIDANTASAAELESVAGIGPATAAKIVKERANGPYADANDLQSRVSGIGARSIRKMLAGGLAVPSITRTPPKSEQPEIIVGRPTVERTPVPAPACAAPPQRVGAAGNPPTPRHRTRTRPPA